MIFDVVSTNDIQNILKWQSFFVILIVDGLRICFG